MLCVGCTRTVELADGDMVKLEDARGTSVRVALGTLWITQHGDPRDVVLNAGDVWAVERNGTTLVEAQSRAALCLVGPGAGPAQIRERRTGAGAWLRGLIARHVLT